MPRQPVQVPGEEAAQAAAAEKSTPIPTVQEPAPAGAPNALDLDVNKLTGPVLTKQGWLVPESLGQRK